MIVFDGSGHSLGPLIHSVNTYKLKLLKVDSNLNRVDLRFESVDSVL